jgi:hypothetical protein
VDSKYNSNENAINSLEINQSFALVVKLSLQKGQSGFMSKNHKGNIDFCVKIETVCRVMNNALARSFRRWISYRRIVMHLALPPGRIGRNSFSDRIVLFNPPSPATSRMVLLIFMIIPQSRVPVS